MTECEIRQQSILRARRYLNDKQGKYLWTWIDTIAMLITVACVCWLYW